MGLATYEFEEELFSVGPSTFFRARNAILGHELMVRRLSIDPTRPDNARETFYREQRHSAQLTHPQIQKPIEVFEEQDHLWSVHEFRTTRPTGVIVREDGPFPIAEAARLGAQIADALAYMHGRHFMHGKVSPQVTLVDERGDAMLINMVKSADLAAGVWPLRAAVVGLSPFSAPEEFHGERPSFESDLYGLAATIVYWLTGRYARGGESEEEALQLANDGADLIPFATIRSEIPTALARALQGALIPDPDERRGSVASLGSLLVELFQRQAAEIPSGFTTGSQLTPVGETQAVEILGRHGAGAFGVVLRAEDRATSTTFAVKALKPEHRDDREAFERFVREARAVQQVDHPNVVRIYGVGEENGTPYAVMDFIEGPDLATLLLREGQITPGRAARLGAGIARGLGAIHRENIIHRDLKPHNILVANGVRPVIADFGVARDTQTTRMTMTGNVVGTPAYMAPEQFEGGTPTHAVDLYAFGSILYEMVSGELPFSTQDPLEMIRAVRHDQPAPLPDEVPHRLQVVIRRLLRKDPEDRPANAFQVADDLERLAERYDPEGAHVL
ncbi:MAG: serine/threonine-protein kinase [Planctomycetota bacterium]|nr:serine/threonine-protein kinase [Planctomycetota bacterium]